MRLSRFVSVLVPSHPRYGTEIEEKNVRGEGRPRSGGLARVAFTACDSAQALGRGIGRHRATAKGSAGALACLLAVAGLFTAASALGATTHPFQSEFTGTDTPAGSLSTADKVGVRQSNGDVYVIDKGNGVVDTFNASGNYVSQVGSFSFGGDPDIAVDNSGTASEGNLYVLPEFGPLSAYDSSGTLLYQLSATPNNNFGDVCGTAVDSSGTLYVADFSNHTIYKFDSSGTFLATIPVGFSPCDIAVDTDGTIWAVQWNVSLHKLAPDGTDLGVIDSQSPRGVGVDLVSHHVYAVHDSSIIEYDPSGIMVSEFGALAGSRGVDINGATGNVYVSSNPAGGSRVEIFGTVVTTGPPTVVSQPASNITNSTATLNAAIDPAGFDTTCVFQYVDDATFQASGYNAATSVACTPADLGSAGGTFVLVSADVSGLGSSTVYHFRAVATNSAGTTNGGDTTFRTTGPPVVVSESATNVTDTTATLNASIVPSGSDTTCQLQYVDDANFQASEYNTATSVDCSPFDLGSGIDPQSASANVIGLTPGTIYHFRAVATNADGTTNGADQTFQTLVSFLVQGSSFGSPGSGAGQFQTPVGVAIQQSNGAVYVADSGNARVEKFDVNGNFLAAWGWGVADGAAHSEVCTATCRAGIPGSGPGQLSLPTSIAFSNVSGGASASKVFVGDAGNNVVVKFDANGVFISTIDGSTTPQGHFVSLAGVAVDQSGNLWTADAGTGNVDEFDPKGKFLQQWASPSGSMRAIAVDATHNAVYLMNGGGTTERFTLTGGGQTTIDSGSGTALALDPQTGNLYVDHGHDVAVYDPTGTRIDTLFSLGRGSTTNSQGLAFWSGKAKKLGALYVADASNDTVTIYGPPPAGPPFITAESARTAGKTSETLKAAIVPLGFTTTCSFQYVSSTDFAATGYTNATTVPCTPANLGASFTYQQASATVSGLTVGAFYHFRVVATNSAGTTTGADQTFQAGPGLWTPFSRCPVDDPAMLATDGVSTVSFCLASNSTHGSITIGTTTNATGNSNLQAGVVVDTSAFTFTVVGSASTALIADSVDVTAGGITVTATVQSAGVPSNFDLLAGISLGMPIITLPIKIHLVGQTVDLGPNCFLGSDMDPILLHPANTDVSNAMLDVEQFDTDGTPNPNNGILASLAVNGTTQGDDTFSVPGASGCGPNGDGSLNAAVNAVVGLPSPSGANHLVLDDASSALAFPTSGLSGSGTIVTGQEFSAAWHSAFD
jgi:sugar lactone lactonase YvrE